MVISGICGLQMLCLTTRCLLGKLSLQSRMIIINLIIIIIHQQVSLGKTISAIKNESDAVVEIRALECNETKFGICQSLDLVDDSKQIQFTQTISVEVQLSLSSRGIHGGAYFSDVSG